MNLGGAVISEQKKLEKSSLKQGQFQTMRAW
jgi:hypothetical protein